MSKNLSDEQIQAIRDDVARTTDKTLRAERISGFIATVLIVAGVAWLILGDIWIPKDAQTTNDILALGTLAIGLWLRSSVEQDRLRRVEKMFALHLLASAPKE